MESIDVGGISVLPYEFVQVLEMEIKKQVNDHAQFYVRGVVPYDKWQSYVSDVNNDNGKINLICKNGNEVYFRGIVQRVNITCAADVYYMEVYASSHTCLLDNEKIVRSYQNREISYSGIVNSIMKESNGKVYYNAQEKAIDKLLLQYDETDWEFMKRLASHTHDILIPAASLDLPEFHFGMQKSKERVINTENFLIECNKATGKTNYVVEADGFSYMPGEVISLNGVKCYVKNIYIRLVKAAFSCRLILTSDTLRSEQIIYNNKIIGLSLPGKVILVQFDKIKIRLSIDEEQYARAAPLFSYATPYSSEKNTGWYVMPEVGDAVNLFFPDADENNAYITSSVREYHTDKITDPNVKYFRTKQGKEIMLSEDEILISSIDDETYIRISDSDGIEIKTPNMVNIINSGDTVISSGGDVTIDSKKSMWLSAVDSFSVSCGENKLEINPVSGVNITSGNNIDIFGKGNGMINCKNNIDFKSGGAVQLLSSDITLIKSQNDMLISSGGNISESANNEIKLMSFKGSAVTLDSNVDIKAKLIKEN